ncbi:MAG: redox-sensing transcriptional repressor Rex [Oscillospiraceae bacterium]|nr:redox-sensing transcriptional repressor Rex [Oscillospiraceae bacterium]
MSKTTLPREVVARLPKYLRYLREFALHDKTKISSGELAEKLGITSSQVRRDLGQLGVNGHNGFGYLIGEAHRRIAEEMGLYGSQRVAIIGAGNIGHALARHRMFRGRGFELMGIYDRDPKLIGTMVGGHKVENVEHLAALPEQERPEIAILATSSESAEKTARFAVSLGIRGILNFCYTDLDLEGALVENIHIDDSLMLLSYQIAHL